MKHDDAVDGALLKDETRILSWSGNTLRLWDVAGGQQIGPVGALKTLRAKILQ